MEIRNSRSDDLSHSGATDDRPALEALSPNQPNQTSSSHLKEEEQRHQSGAAFAAAGDVAPNLFENVSSTDTTPNRSLNSSTNTGKGRQIRGERGSTTDTSTSTAVARSGSTTGDVDDGSGVDGEETGRRAEMPPTTRTMTSVSGKPYSAFSSGTRWMIVTLAGIAAVFSPIRSVLALLIFHLLSKFIHLQVYTPYARYTFLLSS